MPFQENRHGSDQDSSVIVGANIHPSIKRLYMALAECGLQSADGQFRGCHCGFGRNLSAVAYATNQEIFGVFGLAATTELLDCKHLPTYYKALVLGIAAAAMALGSYQQCQKCRKKYIPSVYTNQIQEPAGLSSGLSKLSAFFELISVAASGANIAQVFLQPVSAEGMKCVEKFFWSLDQALPRLGGMLTSLAMMGPQMWYYYHKDSPCRFPFLVSAGYSLGSFSATAFPLILELMKGQGIFWENIAWLVGGLIVNIPKTVMLTKQHKQRMQEQIHLAITDISSADGEASERQPLVQVEQHAVSQSLKTAIALGIPLLQTAFNARSMVSMATTIFDDPTSQLILIIVFSLLCLAAILVPIGRFAIY